MATTYQRTWAGEQARRHRAEATYVADPDLEWRLRAFCVEIGMAFPWRDHFGVATDDELVARVCEWATRHLLVMRYGPGAGASLVTRRGKVVGAEVEVALLSRGVTQAVPGPAGSTLDWPGIGQHVISALTGVATPEPMLRAVLAATADPRCRSALCDAMVARVVTAVLEQVPVAGPTDHVWFARFAAAVMAAIGNPATDWAAEATAVLSAVANRAA